jgi:hypothetical protein
MPWSRWRVRDARRRRVLFLATEVVFVACSVLEKLTANA